ncbi:hypothetical protein D3800_05975 [Microcystis aeruginosa NIES-298]|uniref:Uncharacterized protein n=1 Tax=Microcystis aeruginosa NIES-298 TaxID=449468 RepID=A0A2H6BMQ2_MICAE|nr:hypothetical protein [Microcystis aeruginosa]QHU82915.1 hypothetical protein D3800_05975 [Microcystis aeruginosa NIES-298]GBD51454.1 hypothetical protein BGM30_05470 [Microcystis aeruginosa NIES-298]GBE99424.1 hypothetical protein NIES298_36720 [Microcystis aeruginosa NIES-298]
MARKRFSDLERIYDALKLGNVNPNSLPQNLDFVKYAKWREGNGPERTIVRPPLNGEVEVGVKAFGYGFDDAEGKIKVTLSGRANAFLNGFGPKAKFGVATTGLNEYLRNGGFVPAKARIATIVAGTTKTSAITGRKYKSKTGQAYTIPMGQTNGTLRYQQAINSILTDPVFAGANATHTVSFDPEEFRRD